jgi:hypothetical protein
LSGMTLNSSCRRTLQKPLHSGQAAAQWLKEGILAVGLSAFAPQEAHWPRARKYQRPYQWRKPGKCHPGQGRLERLGEPRRSASFTKAVGHDADCPGRVSGTARICRLSRRRPSGGQSLCAASRMRLQRAPPFYIQSKPYVHHSVVAAEDASTATPGRVIQRPPHIRGNGLYRPSRKKTQVVVQPVVVPTVRREARTRFFCSTAMAGRMFLRRRRGPVHALEEKPRVGRRDSMNLQRPRRKGVERER